MKLETKHLAAYLPYGLNCLVDGKIARMNSVYSDGTCTFFDLVESEQGFESVKPILKPLSMFENITEVTNEMSEREIENLKALIEIKLPPVNSYVNNVKFFAYERMIEHHFDVFGLIDAGIAVDINTIKK